MIDWRTIPDGHEKRHAYMASREWAILKEAVKSRSRGLCERCRVARGEQTHHQTYVRLYHERLSDLLHVCRACHLFISGKSDIDPIQKISEKTEYVSFDYKKEGYRSLDDKKKEEKATPKQVVHLISFGFSPEQANSMSWGDALVECGKRFGKIGAAKRHRKS